MNKDTESKDFAAGRDSNSLRNDDRSQNEAGKNVTKANYRRLVTPDPAAFRYLEEDPATTVLERRRRLQGYELYFVEQWGCSRVHPTFCITTYTGLEHHSVLVGVLSIPTDEQAWSPRLRVYLKAIAKYHARAKDTPLGTLMVTNLSGFPSALTVIPVPDGDLKRHREDFIVNEDLKRLGCSGRAGLNVAPPTAATQTKFTQTYHTSDQVPIQGAVIEIVKLCQVALMFFDKLAPEYADGLLCDVTETAIGEWWSDIGSDIFNVDPSDGILGPTTVAALLGLLFGARNRLAAYGAPVSKDVFDIPTTKRAIAHFQKSQKLEPRTRRLDRQTLDRLHKVTAKAASGEGWTVPRAVKSTVAELSGKGEQMANEREGVSIAEVETLDISTLVQLGSGERFRWLWHGKPRKNNEGDIFGSPLGEDEWIFNDNDQGGFSWSSKRKESVEDDRSLRHTISDRMYFGHGHSSQVSLDHVDKDPALRKAVLRNVTGKVTDARSGLGRIRDAVGRRGLRAHGHGQKASADDTMLLGRDFSRDASTRASEGLRRSLELPFDDPRSGISFSDSEILIPAGSNFVSRSSSKPPKQGIGNHEPASSSNSAEELEIPSLTDGSVEPDPDYLRLMDNASGITHRQRGKHENVETGPDQTLGSKFDDFEAVDKMKHFDWTSHDRPPLRSTCSLSNIGRDKTSNTYWQQRWPRHLSFTAMVDVVAGSQPLATDDPDTGQHDSDVALTLERSLVLTNRVMQSRLQRLKTLEAPWVEEKLAQIEAYDEQCGRDQSQLDMVFHQKTEEHRGLQDASEELLSQERTALSEASKDIETLGAKVEYELNALQGKVEDVEDGVQEFERQVVAIEARVREQLLEDHRPGSSGSKEGWIAWFLRS